MMPESWCHRLDRQCLPSATKRRIGASRIERIPQTSTSTVQLQDKVDEILSLLKSGDALNILLSPSSQADRDSVVSSASDRQDNIEIEPNDAEAEANLEAFKTYNLRFLPILYLPAGMTAQALKSERPYLWLCITAITTKSTARSQQLSARFKQVVADAMVVRSEKSLDLLQALLVFVGWFNLQNDSTQQKPSLAVFVQLAIAAVFDLHLHRPPMKEVTPALCLTKGEEETTEDAVPARSVEEHRTVLGCFLITSIVSAFIPKIDSLRWTAQLQCSLEALESSRESPSDELLALQVRFQLVIERITLSDWYEGTFEHSNGSKILQPMYAQALQSQIHQVSSNLPHHLRSDTTVLAHLHTAEISIHNLAIAHVPSAPTEISFQRIKRLTSCLHALKSWFENFFRIPAIEYFHLTFSIISQLVRCLGTLYQLTSLREPGWSRDDVKNTADLVGIVTRVASNMEQVASLAGIDHGESPGADVFTRSAKLFRAMLSKWSEELHLPPGPFSNLQAGQASAPSDLEAFDFDWSDNSWMIDFSVLPNFF